MYRSFRRRDLEAKSSQRNHVNADLHARRALAAQLPYPLSSSSHGRAVLKITITDLSGGQRWSLQGQLVGQWAVVLQSTWREARHTHDTQKCIVELMEVTSIDKHGEAVLAEIMSEGVDFIATDVYTKHLLANMRSEL